MVEWYKKNLNMDFIFVFVEDYVFLIKVFDFYMYLFLNVGNGNVLVFFELLIQFEMGCDENILKWVQYIVFKVKDCQVLIDVKEYLEVNGIEVLGIINYGIFYLIYFFDLNGYCLELVYDDEKVL